MAHYKIIPNPLPQQVIKLLNKNIFKSFDSECWKWRGRTQQGRGYAIACINNSPYRVSRLLYTLIHNQDPLEYVVRHTCDNPHCVNPHHLILGTQKQNIDDAVIRNRMPKGEQVPFAKLTEVEVIEILQIAPTWSGSWRSLALKYSISYNTLKHLLNRVTWKHLHPPHWEPLIKGRADKSSHKDCGASQ